MNNLICQCQIDKQKDQNPFGLYYISELNQRNLVKLPIEKVEFNVEIINNISKVQIIQSYHNFSTIPLSAQYLFPISSDSCFHSFKAEFNNEILSGIIKEKEEAKKEFNDHKEKGNTVALQQISEDSPDIMKIDIANIQANSTIKIYIEFIEELQITMNQFYTFKILSILTPRYCNSEKMVDFPEYNIVPNINHKPCITTLNIQLNTSSPIELLKSPSHDNSLQITNQNADKTQTNLQISNILFEKDFVLLFKDEDINKPSVILGSTDTQVCAQLNFIPNFSNLQADDAYKQYLKDEKVFEVDINNCQSEFIFLLDRSYSMSGSRIEQAKSALKCFIKSLPFGSYFNICSFGSKFSFLYDTSIQYTQETQEETLKKIEEFKADFGGTEILNPIKAIFQQKPIQNLPRQIFLLTDGDISSPKEIIYHIQENLHNSRLHTIGIGSGCSEYCIKQTAIAGKGKHIFINDNDNMNNNIINLLEKALSPYINEFTLQYDKNLIEEITPNPEKIKCILKNEQITFYILFKPGLSLEQLNSNIILSYLDPQINQSLNYLLQISPLKTPKNPNICKLAIFNKLKSLQQDLDNYKFTQNNQKKPLQNLKNNIISLSIDHQLLSSQTAFICLIKSLNDQESQQFTAQRIDPHQNIQQQQQANQCYFALAPPEIQMSADHILQLEAVIQEAQNFPLPSDDDDEFNTPKQIQTPAKSRQRSRSRSNSPAAKSLKSPSRQYNIVNIENSKESLQKIIDFQKFQGNWELTQDLLDIIGLSKWKFISSIPKEIITNSNNENIVNSYWITVIVYHYLEIGFAQSKKSWSLIQKKAFNWLYQQNNYEIQIYKDKIENLFQNRINKQ